MWARVHRIDRARPLANGGAVILIEDERATAQIVRTAAMSTLIAVARVLDARQLLDLKFGGKGEVWYAPAAPLPSFLAEAVARAGAHVSDRAGNKVLYPAQPASVSAIVDVAFSDLAHATRGNAGVADLATTLQQVEADRRRSPLDRDQHPLLYWPAVFELASLAGELARRRGGRWIEIPEMPVPFAVKFPDSHELARPTAVAQRIVEGKDGAASLVGG